MQQRRRRGGGSRQRSKEAAREKIKSLLAAVVAAAAGGVSWCLGCLGFPVFGSHNAKLGTKRRPHDVISIEQFAVVVVVVVGSP